MNKNNNPNGKGGAKAGEPSRNPNGRPPKDKSLTHLIRQGGSTRVVLPNGQKVNRSKALSEMLWNAVLTGNLVTLEGEEIRLGAKDIIGLSHSMLNRVDGMPRQALEVSQTPTEVIITSDEMAAAVKELKEFTSED